MNLNKLYERKSSALVQAIRKGNAQSVKDLLESGTFHPNSNDHRGWTPLHEATFHNKCDIVKILLEDERTNPDAVTHKGELALNIAVRIRACADVQLSLAECTETLRTSEEYATNLLCSAIRTSPIEVVKYVLKHAPVDIQGKKNFTPISPVCESFVRRETEFATELINACSDINDLQDEKFYYYKKTLLGAISVNCSIDIIRLLIHKGAYLSHPGNTPLILAIELDRKDIVFELLKHNVDVNCNKNGYIALSAAILRRQKEVVEKLLPVLTFNETDVFAAIDPANPVRFAGPICCALSSLGRDDILQMLLDFNLPTHVLESPVNVKFKIYRVNLLYHFAGPLAFLLKERMEYREDCLSLTKQLISKGISIEPINQSYMPPLVGALLSSSECSGYPTTFKSILNLLLELNINVDYKLCFYPDALLALISENQIEVFKELLAYSRYSPCESVYIGMKHNINILCDFILENMINNDDYSRLRNVWFDNVDDKTYRAEELFTRFSFPVPPLTVIARQKIRQCLKVSENTAEFLSFINKLPLPETLKRFVRYMD